MDRRPRARRGSVVRIGKSALIPADVAEEKLHALARTSEELDLALDTALNHGSEEHESDVDFEPKTVSDILRAVGRRHEDLPARVRRSFHSPVMEA